MSEEETNNGGQSGDAFDWSPHVEDGTDTSKLPQNATDLAKGYLGLNKVTGEHATKLEKALFVPADDADDATRDAFYAKLGRPENAEGYGLEAPKESGEFGKKTYTAMQTAAHAAGLSKSQMEKFHSGYLANMKEASADVEGAQKQVGAELKTLWGDDYAAKEVDFNRAMNEVLGGDGAEKFSELLLSSGMMQANPKGAAAFMDMASKIISAKKEASPPPGAGAGGGAGGNAREAFDAFKRDNKDKINSGDKWALGEWNRHMKEIAAEERK